MTLSEATRIYQAYLEAQRAGAELDEDLAKARREMELAWLKALA